MLAVTLIAGHGVVLYYVSSHLELSVALVAGAILLIVIKHLGFLGPAYAVFRGRWWKRRLLRTAKRPHNSGCQNDGSPAVGGDS